MRDQSQALHGHGEEEPEAGDPEFLARNARTVEAMAADPDLAQLTAAWMEKSVQYEYSYHFSWLGLPIIQYPADLIALQEIVWRTRPDLIIETGVARGGSMVFYASLLELCGSGQVVGVDNNLSALTRTGLSGHAMASRINIVDGSSVDAEVVDKVRAFAESSPVRRVMVVLDSNHTHDHVLAELRLYSPFVTTGNYLVVLDTVIDEMAPGALPPRPWSRGNSPATAVSAFLAESHRFEVDRSIDGKLLTTVAPGGYLRCIAT